MTNCALCNKHIENYTTKLNHLVLDDSTEVDLCINCIDKFLKWQKNILTDLFPRKGLAKRNTKSY